MSAAATLSDPRVVSRLARGTPRVVASAEPAQRIAPLAEQVTADSQQPLLLDVRGAPMAAQQGWTLAVLDSLEVGRRVLHVTDVVPWQLFPMLVTRGVRYEIQNRHDGDVRILMWRHWEPSGVWPCRMRVERIRVL